MFPAVFWLNSSKKSMAPKENMKAKPLAKGKFAMKALASPKKKQHESLPKGGAGSSKDKKQVKKNNLKKKQLAKLGKLGKMTLAEKVAKAAEDAENPAEAAKELKGMSKAEPGPSTTPI